MNEQKFLECLCMCMLVNTRHSAAPFLMVMGFSLDNSNGMLFDCVFQTYDCKLVFYLTCLVLLW